MTSEIGPEYRRVMGVIRDGIISGKYPVGSPIPSTTELQAQTGASFTVVRRAVRELQGQGILEGHPGKAVYVRATPADADAERMSIEVLGQQVAEIRKLAERDGLDEIRAVVGRLESNLIELYGLTGHDYPEGGADDAPETAAGHGRPRR